MTTITTAAERVRAYLDEMDRIDAARPQYSDEVHGINDRVLFRSDLRALLDAPVPSVQGDSEEVVALRAEVAALKARIADMSWGLNPDRMGQ